MVNPFSSKYVGKTTRNLNENINMKKKMIFYEPT